MLAFRAAGYDTCPMEGIDQTRIKKLLNLAGDAEVCMVISAGRRAENGVYGPQLRFSRDQFVKEV
jgi:nitroreductase